MFVVMITTFLKKEKSFYFYIQVNSNLVFILIKFVPKIMVNSFEYVYIYIDLCLLKSINFKIYFSKLKIYFYDDDLCGMHMRGIIN